MWSWEIADTVTGERLDAVHLAQSSWSLGMNSRYGSGSSVIETRDSKNAKYSAAFWANLETEYKHTLVGKWNEDPVWAHVIKEVSYDVATGQFKMQHAELPALVSNRYFWPHNVAYNPNAVKSYTNLTRAALMRAVCREACGGGFSAPVSQRRLPVLFDMPQSGFISREFRQHEFVKPWSVMTEYSDVDDGVDFSFEASFTANTSGDGQGTGFHWYFKTGSFGDVESGFQLRKSYLEASVSTPGSDVLSAVRHRDGAAHATGVWVAGEGSGADRPIARSSTTTRPEVAKFFTASSRYRDRNDLLGRLANSYTRSFGRGPYVWALEMLPDRVLPSVDGPEPDGIRPGSRLILHHAGDGVLGADQTELYVTAMSGGIDGNIRVEAQSL